MKQYYISLFSNFEKTNNSFEKQCFLIFSSILVSVMLYQAIPFNNFIQNSPPPQVSKITALANCAAPVETFANKIARAHMGGAVNIPVGTNLQGLKRWSATNSWESGKPGSGDDVLIPSNSVIVLDENINVKSIKIAGKLIIDLSKDISIATEYILIDGSNAYFEWGTKNQPYIKKGLITLKGSNRTQTIPGTGVNYKAIVVSNKGVMEIHGNKKKSWTRLATNAAANQNKITVSENVNGWTVGDEILIVSSRLDWNEAEKRTIIGVSGNNRVFTLSKNLKFPHIGRKKSYTRGKDGKTWDAEIRAEVGLLSKSIKIQGDTSSEKNQFGGHVMIHSEAQAHVDGIELYRMGQKMIKARYPFHWHLLEEKGAGQYLKNSSIHRSYNRAITIHATESVLVEDNFAYDHIGHGLFLEDGSERFNVIRGNVIAVSKRPKKGEELTPSDNQLNEIQNRTPAQFWITNPNNIFENNVAAGSEGTGFWFAMPQKPLQESRNIPRYKNLEPHKEKLGKFSGNTSHSCKSGFDIFDQLDADHNIIRNGGWIRTDKRYIDTHIFYANDLANYGGIGEKRKYTEGVVFRDNIYSDNKTSLMYASYPTIENSIFIANSGEDVFKGERKLNRGYDGSSTLKNCHLVGWNADNANYVQNTGGAQKHVNYKISGITLSPDTSVRMSFPDYGVTPSGEVGANSVSHPRFWSYVHWDIDGSLGGKANTSIITNHPLCRDGSEVRYANWTNLYRTDRRFAYALIDVPGDPKMTMVRTKSGTPKAGQYYMNGFYGTFIHFPVMVNDGFLYTLQFESLGTGKSVNIHMKDDYVPGDSVLYRIKDFGRLPGVTVSNADRLNSLNSIKNANSNSYAIVGNDLYLKMVSVSSTPDILCSIGWSSNITLPKLDTDGDGISDKQESKNGTDPIENDPIPENPVIAWSVTQQNQRPILTISDPSDTVISEGYTSVYVKAEANDPDGDPISLTLYIDGKEIRRENKKPYEWGHSASPNPQETSGLTIGDHEFRIVANDNRGGIAEKTFILEVEASLSINNMDKNTFSIYPNPSPTGVFTLSEKKEWKVYNLLGSLLNTGNGTIIKLVSNDNGLYLLKIGAQTFKIIKR